MFRDFPMLACLAPDARENSVVFPGIWMRRVLFSFLFHLGALIYQVVLSFNNSVVFAQYFLLLFICDCSGSTLGWVVYESVLFCMVAFCRCLVVFYIVVLWCMKTLSRAMVLGVQHTNVPIELMRSCLDAQSNHTKSFCSVDLEWYFSMTTFWIHLM